MAQPGAPGTRDTSPAPRGNVPRSRKGIATRARLIDAAQRVFEESGFLETRITDIAEAANLTHGSFYHYFDSKEEIFREVAEAQEAALTAHDDSSDDSPPTSEYDRILRANRLYLERYRANAKIMGVIEEVSRYDDEVNRARTRRQKHFADRAEAGLRRLQADGYADPDIDPGLASLALGSMVARFAELWLVEEWGSYDLDEVAEQLTRLWAGAVGLRTRRRPRN